MKKHPYTYASIFWLILTTLIFYVLDNQKLDASFVIGLFTLPLPLGVLFILKFISKLISKLFKL